MRRRGFSLYEMLLSMFLVLLVLGILAELLRSYSQAAQTQAAKGRVLEAAQLALDRLRNELREALVVDTPATGSSAEVVLHKVDPAMDRFPTPAPTPPPLSWDPNDPNHQCKIRYYLDLDVLYRFTELKNGTQRLAPLLDGVVSLRCQRQTDGSFDLTLAVRDREQTRQLVTKILRVLP